MDDRIYFKEEFSNARVEHVRLDSFSNNFDSGDHFSDTETIFDHLFEDDSHTFDDDNDMSDWFDV